jgi:predicted HicB family RNase H-like nuclease
MDFGGRNAMKERLSLDKCLRIPYRIEIVKIPEDEGGGFLARLPKFGSLGVIGDGETELEALRDLEENKRIQFQQYLDEGRTFPEPETSNEEGFSGRFLLRIPREIHARLARSAKENGVSLNQYTATLLAEAVGESNAVREMADIRREWKEFKAHLKNTAPS